MPAALAAALLVLAACLALAGAPPVLAGLAFCIACLWSAAIVYADGPHDEEVYELYLEHDDEREKP